MSDQAIAVVLFIATYALAPALCSSPSAIVASSTSSRCSTALTGEPPDFRVEIDAFADLLAHDQGAESRARRAASLGDEDSTLATILDRGRAGSANM